MTLQRILFAAYVLTLIGSFGITLNTILNG
jgi:hypothetical protein